MHSVFTTAYNPLYNVNNRRQSSQYRRIEIRVIEARGLAKADRFGLSDPFVVIYANGQTEVKFCVHLMKRMETLNHFPMYVAPETREIPKV